MKRPSVEPDGCCYIARTLEESYSKKFRTDARRARVAQLVEHRFCKPVVVGSSPSASLTQVAGERIDSGRWQSGQMHQTVNLASSEYGGSNPSLPSAQNGFRRRAGRSAGVAQLAELQPSKLDVVGSNPIARLGIAAIAQR